MSLVCLFTLLFKSFLQLWFGSVDVYVIMMNVDEGCMISSSFFRCIIYYCVYSFDLAFAPPWCCHWWQALMGVYVCSAFLLVDWFYLENNLSPSLSLSSYAVALALAKIWHVVKYTRLQNRLSNEMGICPALKQKAMARDWLPDDGCY